MFWEFWKSNRMMQHHSVLSWKIVVAVVAVVAVVDDVVIHWF